MFILYEFWIRRENLKIQIYLFALNGFNVHPSFILRFGFVSKIDSVAIFTVNFAIKTIVKWGGIQVTFTLVTAETVFVDKTGLNGQFVHLKGFRMAPYAGVGRFFILNGERGGVPEFILSSGTESSQVTHTTINLEKEGFRHIDTNQSKNVHKFDFFCFATFFLREKNSWNT